MKQNVFKDMAAYLPAYVVPGIVGFISIPIITKLFSPSDYGDYSLALATIAVLTALSSWLPMSVIRFHESYKDNLKYFYANIVNLTFKTLLVITLCSLFGYFLVRHYLSGSLYHLLMIGSCVFVFDALFSVFLYVLRIRRLPLFFSFFTVALNVGSLLVALVFMFVFHYGIESLLLGKIVCACLLVPFLWAKSMQRSFNIELKTDMVFFHRLAIYSFPLVAGNLSAWLLNLSDRYILQIYRSVQEVGIYSASYSIADKSVMLFVNLFMFASGPIIMRLWEREGEARTKEFNSSMARYFLMICMPMVVGLCVLAKPIIRLLTGPQYFDGYTIVPFIAIGVFFFGLQQMFQTGFLLHKKTVFITIGICIAGVFNIILNFIFVPSFGYVAAASAALASYVLLSLIMIVGSRRLYKWDFPCRSLCRISTAVVVMGIVVHYLYIAGVFSRSSVIELLLLVFFGFIVNLLMLFVLREFSNEELSYAKQFFLRAVGR